MEFGALGWFNVAHLIVGVTCSVFLRFLASAIVDFSVVPAVIVMHKVSLIESAVNVPRD